MEIESNGDRPRSPAWVRWAAIAAGVVALIVLGRVLGGYVQSFARWVESLGALGPLVFMAGYVLATVGFVPAFLLTVAAGAIFGLLWGTVYVWFAATLGACAAFLVARYVARGPVERRIEGNRSFAAIDRAVGSEGLKIVNLLHQEHFWSFLKQYCKVSPHAQKRALEIHFPLK